MLFRTGDVTRERVAAEAAVPQLKFPLLTQGLYHRDV